MHNNVPNTPRYRKIWANISYWMKALDEAVDYDPHRSIIRHLKRTEERLDRLEKLQIGHEERSHNTQRLEVHNVH